MRVLVVDDNPGDVELVLDLLERGSSISQFRTTDTLSEGIGLASSWKPEIVFLDLRLPDSRGLDTLETFRAHAPDLPVIILTGVDDLDLSVQALRRGADDYLVKGTFTAELLRRAVTYSIERRRMHLRLEQERRTVETLQAIGASLAAELDRRRLLERLLDAAMRLIGAESAAFFSDESSDDGSSSRIAVARGRGAETLEKSTAAQTALLTVLSARRLPHLIELGRDDRFAQLKAGELGVCLAVPVVSRSKEMLGVLVVGHSQCDCFGPEQEKLAANIASWAALALDNARLFEHANKAIEAREQILRIVSHDVRNHLMAVVIGLELIRENDPPKIFHDQLNRLEKAVSTIRRLIGDLLDMAALDKGTLTIAPRQQPCGEILEEAAKTFVSVAAGKGIRLEQYCETPDLLVRADRDRVVQVIGNLIGNALKFTPRGGSISVGAQPSDGAVVFTVRDTGSGISPADQQRVFERFYRGIGSTTEGLGLGLSIARAIVAAHSGKIWLESTPGKGTAVSFTVPVDQGH